jgi:hypothetical protein
VVTHVAEAGATTVVISGGKKAAISLEASSEAIEAIRLGEAGAALSVKSEKSIGLKTVTQQGLTPLVGLMKVQPRYWSWNFLRMGKSGPVGVRKLDTAEIRTMAEEKKRPVKEAFYFGQLL